MPFCLGGLVGLEPELKGCVVSGEKGLHRSVEEVVMVFWVGDVTSPVVGVSDLLFDVVALGDPIDLL